MSEQQTQNDERLPSAVRCSHGRLFCQVANLSGVSPFGSLLVPTEEKELLSTGVDLGAALLPLQHDS